MSTRRKPLVSNLVQVIQLFKVFLFKVKSSCLSRRHCFLSSKMILTCFAIALWVHLGPIPLLVFTNFVRNYVPLETTGDRPKFVITKAQLINLHETGITWCKIATCLNIIESTLYRGVLPKTIECVHIVNWPSNCTTPSSWSTDSVYGL